MIEFIIKRDGKKQKFDAVKIKQAIFKAASQIYPQEKANKVSQVVLSTVLKKISFLKKKFIHIEEIQDIVEETLMAVGFPQVTKAYILYRKYRQELRTIKESLGVKDELKFSLAAISILKERYLLKDKKGQICETSKQLFYRVANYIACAERNFSANKENFYRDLFYQMMSRLEFLPNSPTLMNAGTPLGQLSACFVLPVGDSIAEIFDTLKAMALIHQSGGGTGFSFSNLRPKGDVVSSTGGIASGPISFMKVFDTATNVIVQGGRRRGANMAILKVNHPDIIDFIEAKLKEGALENFNISVGVTNSFMEAVKKNKDFYLINPRTNLKVKKIKAQTLFLLIALSAYQCAEPGLVFLDIINLKHPLKSLGKIEATNPCGEVPLLSYESCNLGSINLAKFVENKKVNWDKLKAIIELAVRFLDDVIEINKYPLIKIETITKSNRKIGLGVMGFADMLIKLRIPYNSKEAIVFASKLMRFIRKCSLEASVKLANERGVFKNWKYSSYARKNIRLRNATLNSIAPTGSISIIADCSSGIEPLFALSFARNVLGEIKIFQVNSLLEEVAREEKIYSKKLFEQIKGRPTLKNLKGIPKILQNIFITTFDIRPEDHLNIQAAFQAFTDNAVSKTINLPQDSTIDDIKDIFFMAYEYKLKGVTIYRYGSRKTQVLYRRDISEDVVVVGSEYSGGCFNRECLI
ncbi:MAG: adenosylcobalamin-dependent ribonucleoside-diphosphate reductase [Candidatus Omnitrophica bacterium]|nr:adenosylcobalamin-dependent ribonucleoside-diphosphate reductase [Candidatus Omnitrophota bacterium]